jgi:cyclopropane fatty-acyl-phospholipid synthase-like methyltransferase
MDSDKIKKFWSNRALAFDFPVIEGQVNFETDAERAAVKMKAEIDCIETNLSLKGSDVVVDLGAGNGQWSLRFAPNVESIYAIEYIRDFCNSIKKRAAEQNISNITVVNCPAEDFRQRIGADVVFISGLLHYTTEEQYDKILRNISDFIIKDAGVLFLREPVSVLDEDYIIDKFSDELGAYYQSYYRTPEHHVFAMQDAGFELVKAAPFFEDRNPLNKRIETRLYYFVFKRKG